jgi:putative aldouronate transport system substrate-binding protein
MKKVSVILSLLLVMVMLVTGCGKKANEVATDSSTTSEVPPEAQSTDTMPETTINIRVMNPVTNFDKVLDVYYDKVKDDPVLSKIKVNLTYVEGADYADKLNLAVTAQEDYDLIFAGAWHGLSDKINDGVFKDISSYFNNDAYPGLKAAFSEDYLSANTFNGKTYAIPLAESYEDLKGIVYREDLREKYNLPEIVDYNTLQQYYDGINAHLDDEGLTSAWNVTSSQGMTEFQNPGVTARRSNIFMYNAGANFYVALNSDNTKVIDAAFAGDDTSHFASFPEGYNKDFISERYENLTKWSQYINSDAVSNEDTSAFDTGLCAATYGTATEWISHTQNIVNAVPGAKLGFFIMDDQQRSLTPGATISNEQAWNFLCVPTWSTKTDAVMAFLDWMWSSKENHDLIQYGIEGEDWEAIGDNAYKTLDAESYVMPGYSFSWNPSYIRYNETVVNDETATKIYDYMYNPASYTLSPLAGFNFNTTNVESEIATINAYSYKFDWAAYGDETAAKIKEYHEACEDAGIEKIRTELIKQVQEFLDAKK